MANETRDPVRDFAEDWEATCHVGEEIKRLLKDREDDPEALREILTRFHLRSEEHTSELQSLMRISYAVFCLKKKTTIKQHMLKTRNYNTYKNFTITN